MKKILFTLIAMTALIVQANAMSYEQARREALFLTDKISETEPFLYEYTDEDGVEHDIGDEDALAEWEDTLSELCVLSLSYSQFFAESGQPQAVSYVALQDDLDEDVLLTIALDGELVFDVVTEVDIYGLLEE